MRTVEQGRVYRKDMNNKKKQQQHEKRVQLEKFFHICVIIRN